jgi:hypothetical protein
VDDEGCEDGEEDAEAQAVETDVCVVRPYHAVAVLVEEVAVLLQYCLVCVLFSPAVRLCAFRGFGGWGDVCARGAWLFSRGFRRDGDFY